MSNDVTNAVKHWQATPARKAVLMCLADRANGQGIVYEPSIPAFCAWTCLGRTAVIQALKSLESIGAISIERKSGYSNRVRILLDSPTLKLNQFVRRTSAGDVPVRETNGDQCGSRTTPMRETHGTSAEDAPYTSNTSNTPLTHKRERPPTDATVNKRSRQTDSGFDEPCPDDVDPQVWSDFLLLRKTKKAPVTKTVIAGARADAIKAGITFVKFLELWVLRGSQGFSSEWIKPSLAQRNSTHGRLNGAAATIFDDEQLLGVINA